MAMHQIAKITFEAGIKTHPQARAEEFDFKAPKWHKTDGKYVKDEDLSRLHFTWNLPHKNALCFSWE